MARRHSDSDAPRCCRAGRTKSWLPTETPPMVSSTSTSSTRPCCISATWSVSVSLAMPSRRTVQPRRRQAAAMAQALELTTSSSPRALPTSLSSSPDAMMATVGRRATRTRVWPADHRRFRRAGDSTSPTAPTVASVSTSSPRRRICSPGRGRWWTTTPPWARPDSSHCSRMTTAVAPRGIGAPVVMAMAVPGVMPAWLPWPARLSPTSFKVTGTVSMSETA